jgi:AraC-like DNA-binding protein
MRVYDTLSSPSNSKENILLANEMICIAVLTCSRSQGRIVKIENQIHCGEVVSHRTTERGVFTETKHLAGSRLTKHAHAAPHLAVLLQGAYFERIGEECYLRLPGDKVFYPELLEHENRFGQLPATCLNVESVDGLRRRSYQEETASPALTRVRELAVEGKFQSLRDAAIESGYHPVYLSRIFRKAYGVSLGDFLRACRMKRSANLIFRTDLALAAIALTAGYYDQSHLTNELTAHAGFTPGELRRLADS